MYRLLFEERFEKRIDEMWIQATVRDGGTVSAKQNKVDKNIYMIPVERLSDQYVRMYFGQKAADLLQALDTDDPAKCTDEENWNGRRCKMYCEVSKFCPQYLGVK